MNARERLTRILTFKEHDRPIFWEFGYWTGTLRRWYKEGLPRKKGIVPETAVDGETATGEIIPSPELDHPIDEDVHDYLGLDAGIKRFPLNCWIYPPFENEILEETEENILYIDDFGITKKERKDGTSMPTFLDWPVKNKEDFEKLKERFNPNDKGRLEANWREQVCEYHENDYLIAMGGLPFGLFGGPRYLLGLEKLCLEFYDDPKFVKHIIRFLTDFWIELFSNVLSQCTVDIVWFWEDMCYTQGPLISPEHFTEFILPSYKQLTNVFRDFGIEIIITDTDGDCTKLIPLFIQGGVTTLLPFEVQSNMDVIEIRNQYPKLGIIGGLDKRKIAQGKNVIEEELKTKLPVMFKTGGYVACADHLIPPDVSWENFLYYRNLIREIAGNSKK